MGNHFNAFGAQDLDKIMLDYNEESVLKAYEQGAGELTTATGVAEIRKFFEGLFGLLTDLSTLDAPVVEVTENPKQVYLIWKCPGSQCSLPRTPSSSPTTLRSFDRTSPGPNARRMPSAEGSLPEGYPAVPSRVYLVSRELQDKPSIFQRDARARCASDLTAHSRLPAPLSLVQRCTPRTHNIDAGEK